MNTILVWGIHGSGKTTLCNLLSKTLSIPYFIASCLINDKNNNLKIVEKMVPDITYNQDKLIKAINNLDYSSIILDGHVTLLDKNIEYLEFQYLHLKKWIKCLYFIR